MTNSTTNAASNQQLEPWRDEGDHAWERRSNVECVECPHCCFTFAAVHTDGNSAGYSCPNCNGCPESSRVSDGGVVATVDHANRAHCASCNHKFCKECNELDVCCKCDTDIPPRTVAERLAQHEHVEVINGVLGGVNPLVSRRRISVHHILSYLYNGESIDYIAENYQLTPEAIKDAIAFAQDVYDDAIDSALRTPVTTASPAAPKEENSDEDLLWERQSTINAIAYEFMKLFGATTKDGWTHDEMQPMFDAAREIITRTFPVLTELHATTPSPDAAREAARKYFCSCGGALTAEEYIEHYFEKGHDRGEPQLLARAAALEISEWLRTGDGEVDANAIKEVTEIIQRRCFPGGGENQSK